jgi:hypothetical protein
MIQVLADSATPRSPSWNRPTFRDDFGSGRDKIVSLPAGHLSGSLLCRMFTSRCRVGSG